MPLLTRRQLVEWMAFEKECGPIGIDRDDVHATYLAYHSSAPHLKKAKLTDPIYRMPWWPALDNFDDEDEDDEDEDEFDGEDDEFEDYLYDDDGE